MSFSSDLFDSMIEDIYALTARPDLEGETMLALRAATNNSHFVDAFPRDMQTVEVLLPIPAYAAQLDIPTLFPRLRGLGEVRVLGTDLLPQSSMAGSRIEIIELGDVYDDYGSLKSNIAYVAGDKVNIRNSQLSYGYIVEAFLAPFVRRESYNSWIAQLYPDVILYWAASLVLSTNGNEEKAAKYMGMVEKQFVPFLKANFLLGATR